MALIIVAGDSKIILAKIHENWLRIDREVGEKHAKQVNVTASINSCDNLIM